ncbi:MAG: glycosyltransferase family 4 protein [Gemmatimonadota bacterium]|jgi:glycosyltransferase involved in cell wall biosynthesis
MNWLDRENPRAGGAETHLHEVFGRLASRGHHVTALVSGWRGCARRARLDGIDVHRSGGRHSFSLTAPLHYRRVLAGRGFDVVVEDLNKVPLFSPLWIDAPVVLLTHHLFGETAFQAAPFPVALATVALERPIPAVYRGCPEIAVSESTREDLIRRGLPADRISVIPNGIDIDLFTPRPEVRADRPTLVFLGRLKEYKRVDLVIDAVHVLADRGVDVDLLIAGEGEQREALRVRAERHGLADRVRLLGFLDEDEKVEVLRRAWIHVLTSPKEGWGISNIEAGACGTPSVVSDSPGLRESVLDGRTGLLVPHGDVAALADAIERLVTDEQLRGAMGRHAREHAESLSWDATTDAFEEYLIRVVEGPRPD